MPAALVARVGNCRELVRPREARAEITGDVAAATHPCPFINVQRQRVSAVDSGESAGIERIGSRALSSIVDAMGAAVTAGETHLYYEDIYDRLVQTRALRAIAVDISDLRWTEIDTPEDLARASMLAHETA